MQGRRLGPARLAVPRTDRSAAPRRQDRGSPLRGSGLGSDRRQRRRRQGGRARARRNRRRHPAAEARGDGATRRRPACRDHDDPTAQYKGRRRQGPVQHGRRVPVRALLGRLRLPREEVEVADIHSAFGSAIAWAPVVSGPTILNRENMQ